MCENCLRAFSEEWGLRRHLGLITDDDEEAEPVNVCQQAYKEDRLIPPGNEIYRDDKVSVFEVAGAGCGSQKA